MPHNATACSSKCATLHTHKHYHHKRRRQARRLLSRPRVQQVHRWTGPLSRARVGCHRMNLLSRARVGERATCETRLTPHFRPIVIKNEAADWSTERARRRVGWLMSTARVRSRRHREYPGSITRKRCSSQSKRPNLYEGPTARELYHGGQACHCLSHCMPHASSLQR